MSSPNIIVLDTETRCERDVKSDGTYVYTADPSLECMCVCWGDLNPADAPIERWTEFDDVTPLRSALTSPDTILVLHNAEFDLAVLRVCFDIDFPLDRVIDSAAVARYNGLPGGLENLGLFFGFEKADGRIMKKLAKPRRPSKDNPDRFWRPDVKPDDFETMYRYCERDVDVVRHAMRHMAVLSDFERAVYAATYRMNQRGLPIDMAAAEQLAAIVDAEMKRMSAVTKEKYGFTLSQTGEVARFLGLESVAKAPLRDFLKNPNLPADEREVGEARQLFGKSSTAKIKKIIARAQVDDKVVGSVIYGGAERTLRFSGAGIQPQNLPRGMGEKQDTAFSLLEQGLFELFYDDAILPTVSNMIRGLIRAPMYVGDYSQIEARLLSWLAGDDVILGAFRRGEDPYKLMAAKIYHKAVEDVTGDERFMGKQTVLGCGYGLGRYGFASMLDITYDVQIEEDEADKIVKSYRKNAPKVVQFWDRIGKALTLAYQQQGTMIKINSHVGVTFKTADQMHLILPSGRRLRYHKVKHTREGWKAYGRLKNGAYGMDKIYPGKLCGHITQATARDVIAAAMVRLGDRPLILQVHDELVMLNDGDFNGFVEAMETRPDWLDDTFPLAVEAFETERYRK